MNINKDLSKNYKKKAFFLYMSINIDSHIIMSIKL
jgi:hypothetical protein